MSLALLLMFFDHETVGEAPTVYFYLSIWNNKRKELSPKLHERKASRKKRVVRVNPNKRKKGQEFL
jgi:hypothetical protein